MDFLTDGVWWIAADLMLTTVLLKAGILMSVLWLVIGLVPARHADVRAALWALGFGALLLLPIMALGTSAPAIEVPLLRFPQRAFQGTGFSTPALGLAVVWVGGGVVLLLRLVLHRLRIARVAASAQPVDGGQLAALLAEARHRVGVQSPVRLALTEKADSPILVGWLRPVVLLPPEVGQWPRGRILAVLCHELGHVRRGDYLWMVLGEVVRALYWVNPIAFLGVGRVRGEQDKACDAVALRAGFPSAVYARHLVEVARFVRGRAVSTTALSFGDRSGLRERVGVLLDRTDHDAAHQRTGVPRVAVLSLSAVIVCTSAWILAATNLWICVQSG